jgi:hypothetical protein
MRKFLLLALLVGLIAVVPAAMAGTTTLSFNITTGSPTLQSCINDPLYYEITTITAAVTGDYIFTITNYTNPNVSLHIYQDGDFTTTNLCANRLAGLGVGYSVQVTLTGGQSYQLVGVVTPPGATGSFDAEIESPEPPVVVALAPDGDPDGDGISGSKDNCPYDYNPDQEDGWGSAMGDACDTEWYNLTGQGVAGFVQKNGIFHLHGNCIFLADGAPRCPVIAAFDPTTFDPAAMPLDIASDDSGTWSVWLYYLHSGNGVDVYQVNIYSTNPPQPDTLVDDRLEIHVNGESWQWYHRGGDTQYHGI